MKAIIKLFLAALKMTFRNKQALIWTFILPVILMVLFGLAFGKTNTLSLKVGVIDQAKNDFSKQYVKSLEKMDAFKVTKGTKGAELKALKDGNRSIVIVIPEGFGDNVAKMAQIKKQQALSKQAVAQTPATIEPSTLDVYYDKTNPTLSNTAKSVMNQITLNMNQKMSGSPELFTVREKEVTTKKISTIDFYAAGIMSMFIMNGGAMAVIIILVGYRERGILTRLKATPLNIASFMGTQIAVRLVIALIQMILLLGIAILGFGAHVAGSWWLLAALVIEGALVFVALGFAISSFARSNQTAQAVAQIITMPMMFLSGVFFPTDTFPKFVQPVIKMLPLTYLADSLRQVMMHGVGFSAVARNMGILAIFGIVIFLSSVWFFRWE